MLYEQTHTKIATVQSAETFPIFKRWQSSAPELKESEHTAPDGRAAVDVWVGNEKIDWVNSRLKGEYIPAGEIATARGFNPLIAAPSKPISKLNEHGVDEDYEQAVFNQDED